MLNHLYELYEHVREEEEAEMRYLMKLPTYKEILAKKREKETDKDNKETE